MWLLDIFKPKKDEIMTTHGVTGTEVNSGMIMEEYNQDLVFPNSIEVYDQMRKSDGTTIGILRAIKQPLVSAKWQVQSGWEEAQDKKIAEFVQKNLFEKVKFKQFLRESLGFLDFWFYYFEKVYEVWEGGMIEWKEFAPRIPKSHYLWGSMTEKEWKDGHPVAITQQIVSTDEKNNKVLNPVIPWNKVILFSYEREGNNFEWVSVLRNAYPHWYYKTLLYKLEAISAERYGVGIPFGKVKSSISEQNKNKLIEFLKNIRSNEQSYGVVTDDVETLEILTPKGTWVGTMIQESIKHHDRKIYDSILAGFLNLTTWEWWSNALSKDQSSFFLRGLQGIADFWIDTMNEQIKELVDMNFNGVKDYPKLTVSDIGSISMDEQMTAIGTAYNNGLLDITQDDKQMIRDILKMPRLTQEQMKEIEMINEQKAIDEKKAMDEKAKQDAIIADQAKKKDKNLAEWDYTGCVMLNVSSKKIEDFKVDSKDLVESEYNGDFHVTLLYGLNATISKKEITEKIKYEWQKVKVEWMKIFEWEESDVLVLECKKEKWLTDINASLRELDYQNDYPDYSPHITLAYCKKWEAKKYLSDAFDWLEIDTGKIVYTSSVESKPKTLSLAESVKPTPREVKFTKNITSFEQFLNKKYDEAVKIVQEAEKEYQDTLVNLYEESDTQRIDGVVCLVYDKTRVTKGKKAIQKITDKLEKKLIGSDLQNEIFDEAIAWSKSTLDDNDTFLANRAIITGKSQINTFIDGYVSNMQGVLYNENRRVLENITLNYGSEASLELAKKTATEITVNKNILMLSFVTHPRALYKFIVYTEAQAEGFTMFKTLVPTDKLPNVIDRPFGMTASLVFTIQTASQINKAASVATEGKTAEAVTGLGLHHGSFEYYYPIASSDLELEEEIARIQREELKKKMDENNQ